MAEPERRHSPEPRKAEPLVVVEQYEGHEAIQDLDTAQLFLQQWRGVLEKAKVHFETERGKKTSLFARLQRWLNQANVAEQQMITLSMDIDKLLSQLRSDKPDVALPAILEKIRVIEEAYQQAMGNAVTIEHDQMIERNIEEEQFEIATGGVMKADWEKSQRRRDGKLGKYGQDCLRIDVNKGIGVVADGNSSSGHSYEVARRASRAAKEILQNVDEELYRSVDEIRWFVDGELNAILHAVNEMDPFLTGGTTLLAARYIKKFDAVLMIAVGDTEACVVAGQDTLPLRKNERSSGALEHTSGIRKIQNDAPLIQKNADEQVVTVASLAEFRRTHPGLELHLALATDGCINNTGKSLDQVAVELVQHGPRALTEGMLRKDDLVLIDMALPTPTVDYQVQKVA
ncbi:MAG: hypothetical protein ACD_41C00348G0009 [uncultured bacterium]|nr:MAG: hypothetical protein ACD_41C00348G0009 [uncultured bacterium]HBY74310.1 hypothetical protein [Candidatus Kerfeldbacteria bacterium]